MTASPVPRFTEATLARIRAGIRSAAGDRNVLQILQGIHAILWCLRGDLIADTIFRIDPERRRSLETAAQGDQQVLCHVVSRITNLLSLGAVHENVDVRFIGRLLDTRIRYAWDKSHLL